MPQGLWDMLPAMQLRSAGNRRQLRQVPVLCHLDHPRRPPQVPISRKRN
ncbi:unnamed protein product [Linum tenue]|uniref:Uncharacterized protein n=1 Tax=Linum tenue TaxID=586396 RepID=A0AAV0LLY7_9ROSI|nr:unnamed protein product [Linum tenue]